MIEPLSSCPSDPIQCLEHIIGYGFANVFGNPIYLGLVLLTVIIAVGIAMKMKGDIFILFFSLGVMIVSAEFLGNWIGILFLIGAGGVFALALLRIIKRR